MQIDDGELQRGQRRKVKTKVCVLLFWFFCWVAASQQCCGGIYPALTGHRRSVARRFYSRLAGKHSYRRQRR